MRLLSTLTLAAALGAAIATPAAAQPAGPQGMPQGMGPGMMGQGGPQGMPQGMGPGMMGQGQGMMGQGMPYGRGPGGAMMSQDAVGMPYTPEDAAAILDARLAALKTVLKLTPEQEKLWPPVEAAIRDAAKGAMARREARMAAPPPTSALDVLSMIADAEEARAKALKTFVGAAKPFVATLTPAQLNRIPAFLGLHDTGAMPESSQLWIFEEEE